MEATRGDVGWVERSEAHPHVNQTEYEETGRLRDRKILQAIAGHNLPVRNLPVKEFNDRRTGGTTPFPQMTGHEPHENGRTKKEDRKIWGRKMTDERIIRTDSPVVCYLCAPVSICGSIFFSSLFFWCVWRDTRLRLAAK